MYLLHFLLVSLGGFWGSICRFLISLQFNLKYIGTLIVNLTGSISIAFLYLSHKSGILPYEFWLLLGIGFFGSYTTFSTFSYETIQLFLKKDYKIASLYVFSSLFCSILLVSIIFSLF